MSDFSELNEKREANPDRSWAWWIPYEETFVEGFATRAEAIAAGQCEAQPHREDFDSFEVGEVSAVPASDVQKLVADQTRAGDWEELRESLESLPTWFDDGLDLRDGAEEDWKRTIAAWFNRNVRANYVRVVSRETIPRVIEPSEETATP